MNALESLSLPVTRAFIRRSTAVWLAAHLALWVNASYWNQLGWELLDNWDSGWYSKIIADGYSVPAWAFYPLYPLIVKALSVVVPLAPYVIGLLLSSALFFYFSEQVGRLCENPDERLEGMAPASRAGWLFFLFSPSSFVFRSHHTESLFIVLTWVAFVSSLRPEKGRWTLAAVASGLGALTRPQGILLANASAVATSASTKGWRPRAVRFVTSGLISGALYACYPLYQWLIAGDPGLAQSSQLAWRPEMTARSFVRTLWVGNPWQNMDSGSLERQAAFFALIVATVLLWKKRRVLAAYVGLCVAVMPAAGEFVGLFRYGAVLFPVLFLAGDKLGRLPRWIVVVISLAWLFRNLSIAHRYALFRWCY